MGQATAATAAAGRWTAQDAAQ